MLSGRDTSTQGTPTGRWFFVGLLALALLPALVFPGDAPFINDDALLLANALAANDGGGLATHGLLGTRGVRYGPLPTWIYQGLLLLTHDPVALVVLHAILLSGAVALAVYGIARASGLWPWFGLVIVASPYLWFYARLLWDNSFNIALTALATSTYATFLSRRSGLALAATSILLVSALLVHQMALAFVIPVAAHFLVFERSTLRRRLWLVLPPMAVIGLLSWRYWWDLATISEAVGPVARTPGVDGLLFALTGTRLISATGLGYFYGNGWEGGPPLTLAVAVTALVFPLALVGVAVSGWRLVQAIRARHRTVASDLAGIALAVVISQAILDALVHAEGHPHYHNATWIAHALLAWTAADWLAKLPWRKARTATLLGCAVVTGALLTVNISILLSLHRSGGTRTTSYGTALANQVEIARAMCRYSPDSEVLTDVPQFLEFPHGLAVLRTLTVPTQAVELPKSRLILRYASPDPDRAQVEIIAQ
jgi:hypothetical protein